jgi:uncharacterized protein VirK/YbjX
MINRTLRNKVDSCAPNRRRADNTVQTTIERLSADEGGDKLGRFVETLLMTPERGMARPGGENSRDVRAVTEDEIVNCYKTILRRPPENSAVVQHHLSEGRSLWELIETFVQSEELKKLVTKTDIHAKHKLTESEYLAISLRGGERLSCYFGHYAFLCENIVPSLLEKLLSEDIVVYRAKPADVTYKIVLSVSHWHQFEGEMTLGFRADDMNLYLLSFTIVPGRIVGLADPHVILVSRMQGSPGKYPELRHATKELREIHPQAAVFAALRGVAQAAGLSHIAGVSASNQVAYEDGKAECFEQAYDGFFASVDAARRNDSYYIAEARPPQRPLPSGKYAHKLRAKKKLDLKAEITNSAATVFRSMMKDPAESSVDERQEKHDLSRGGKRLASPMARYRAKRMA